MPKNTVFKNHQKYLISISTTKLKVEISNPSRISIFWLKKIVKLKEDLYCLYKCKHTVSRIFSTFCKIAVFTPNLNLNFRAKSKMAEIDRLLRNLELIIRF